MYQVVLQTGKQMFCPEIAEQRVFSSIEEAREWYEKRLAQGGKGLLILRQQVPSRFPAATCWRAVEESFLKKPASIPAEETSECKTN